MVIRRSVGATPRTLLAATLLEGGAAAAAALAIGVPAGVAWTRAAASGWPGRVGEGSSAPLLLLAIAGALVVLGGAAAAFVFAPRRRLTDAEPRPLGLVIPTLQLGLALVALTAGVLIARGARLSAAPGGLAARGQVFRTVAPQQDPAARSRSYASLLSALRQGTRYDMMSLSGQGSVVGLGAVGMVTTECGRCPYGGLEVPQHTVAAAQQYVSADSFQALGVHLVAGRGISDRDDWPAPRVAVVSRGLARRHFENGEAVGRRLLLSDDPRSWYTVVGVVDDPPARGLGAALLPPFTVYASVLQHPPRAVELLVRPRLAAAGTRDALPGVVARTLAVDDRELVGETEAAVLAHDQAPLAWFGRMFTVEGWLTLLLAALGTVVQMRIWVRSLTPELGLRRALGARRFHTMSLVLVRAALVGAGGAGLGLCLGPAVWGALGTIVRGLPGWDTGLVLSNAGILVTTTVVAALGPAWAAARSAPARLLAAA
jgi:putative ABC transport system permease protein